MKPLKPLAGALLAIFASHDAFAVRPDPEGYGQALIYPYYTAQQGVGSGFNTYLSVVNSTSQGKAVRVRFRESRMGEEAASLNLYLSPNDVWTAAVIPHGEGGARLISQDTSCTDPELTLPTDFSTIVMGNAPGLNFTNRHYAADGAGAGLDRTREGYVEMLEMATLTGSSLAYATPNSAGIANCAYLRSDPTPRLSVPTGGLAGTLTLIDVARGMDFTLKAQALADLASRPYFRPPADPYPDYDAAEVDPVSTIQIGNRLLRSQWPSGVDAVRAALSRAEMGLEYVLEENTRSLSDLVVTFPLRHLETWPPWAPSCISGGQNVGVTSFNRATRKVPVDPGVSWPLPLGPATLLCGAANVIPVTRDATQPATSLLQSQSLGSSQRQLVLPSAFTAGWIKLSSFHVPIPSLANSTRWDAAANDLRAGSHQFLGHPMIGFSVRSFENGTLVCSSGSCQGNYGGAFAASYRQVGY